MDDDVEQVIAGGVERAQVVVEGEAGVADRQVRLRQRTLRQRAFLVHRDRTEDDLGHEADRGRRHRHLV